VFLDGNNKYHYEEELPKPL